MKFHSLKVANPTSFWENVIEKSESAYGHINSISMIWQCGLNGIALDMICPKNIHF